MLTPEDIEHRRPFEMNPTAFAAGVRAGEAPLLAKVAELEVQVQAANERATFLTAMTREAQQLGTMYGDEWTKAKDRIVEQALEILSAQAQAQENHERAKRLNTALLKVLKSVQDYLPPDGKNIKDAMTEIIEAVDPWPVADDIDAMRKGESREQR